jgi:transcriptional antiterminator RfaH
MTLDTIRHTNVSGRSLERVRPSCLVEVDCRAVERSSDSLSSTTARWHVLHTKPRQEKAVARALQARGVSHYLPLQRVVRYYGRRKRLIESPLFASYVFLYGPLEATYFATATKRVATVIAVHDQERFGRELDQIHTALTNGADLRGAKYLAVGRRVRITAGPFRGIEGLIEESARPQRLLLQVAALGRATSLEIDADLLEPVD